ncbi:MAG: PAS domain S-box protein [bacterium]|nr:PAS domain S-box protein [bacterium]
MSKPTYEELEKRVKELEKAETEHKKAEDTLKESKLLLSSIIESPSNIIILTLDNKYRYTSFNSAHAFEMKKVWGVDIKLGENILDYIPNKRERQKANEYFDRALNGEQFTITDDYGYQKERFWYETTYSPIYDKSKIKGFTLFILDITDRKKAEEKLLLERSKLMNIFEAMIDGIYIVNNQQDIEYVNRVIKDEFGPVKGRKCYEYFHGLKEVCQWCKNEEVFAGKSIQWEWYSSKNNKYYDLFDTPIKNLDGTTSKLEIFHDITERKKAEEALKYSEEKYRTLVENVPDVTWTTSEKGNTVYISTNIEKVYGFNLKEIYEGGDDSWLGRIHPDDIEEVKKTFELLFTKNKPYDVEYRIQRKDGEWIWAHDRSISTYEKDGMMYADGIFTDITERKKVDEALKSSEERLRSIIENTDSGYFFIDKEGMIKDVNNAWVNMYKYSSSDEILGKHFTLIQKNDDVEEAKVFVAGIMKGNPDYFTGEFSRKCKDGSIGYHTFSARPVSRSGEVIGIEGFIIDSTERKKTEEALRESERHLNKAQEMAHIGHFKYNPENNDVEGSEELFKIFGLSRDEFKFENFFQAVHPEDREYVGCSIQRGIDQAERYDITHRLICKDGTEKTVHAVGEPITDKSGKTKFMIGTVQDITERKKVDEYRAMSAQMLDVAPNSILVHDFEGNFLYANKRTFEKHQYNREEFIKLNLHDIDVPESKALIESRMKQIRKDGEALFEVSHFRKDKSSFPMEVYVKTVTWAGKPALLSIGTDITERKKTEMELRDSELLLQESQRTSKLGSYVYDIVNDSMSWTETLDNIFGMKDSMKLNVKRWVGTLYEEDKATVSEYFMKEVLGKGNNFDKEYRIVNQETGKTVWVHGLGELEFDVNNNPIKMMGTIQDVTERKLLEEQLQIRQRMDSLGTLAGGIAHDFNNILVGILGNIELLNMNNENFTEDQKECLTDAGQSCNRAANLIRQFQTLSTGAVRGKTAVDIHDISKEVFSLLKETSDRLITKRVQFKKGEFFVTANSGELHQVLLNLATNSAQAIEERGAKEGDYIRIKAEDYEVTTGDRTGLAEGDYVHISFADNGMGMSEEVLKKAFDPMFTTKEKGGKRGQGLGLAMAYNIITRIYNGHIWIDSKEGKGTTFHIYLPKAQPEVEADSKKAIDIKGGTETILVVDDEDNVRKFTRKLLTQIGYTVIAASDGKEALKIYKKQKGSIDTVILDLTMPQMSGQQVFQKLLEISPDVKVIISSGHGDEYSKKGILAKAKGNLGKPYKMRDLAMTVRSVLDS